MVSMADSILKTGRNCMCVLYTPLGRVADESLAPHMDSVPLKCHHPVRGAHKSRESVKHNA